MTQRIRTHDSRSLTRYGSLVVVALVFVIPQTTVASSDGLSELPSLPQRSI